MRHVSKKHANDTKTSRVPDITKLIFDVFGPFVL